jgi:hypothetical protein
MARRSTGLQFAIHFHARHTDDTPRVSGRHLSFGQRTRVNVYGLVTEQKFGDLVPHTLFPQRLRCSEVPDDF